MAQGTFTLPDGQLTDRHIAAAANIDPDKIAQRALSPHTIPLSFWRVWDALGTNIATPAADDLGIASGTYGTDPPYVSSGDLKSAGSTTRRMRALVPLPPNYEAGETLTLRLNAGMVTTVADTAASVDVEAWRVDEDGTLGASDLCTTSAQSINSLDEANKDFTISPSTLNPGDLLDVRVSVTVNDAATVTAVIAALYWAQLLADLR